jgi:phage regulator Rha-like protein
MTKKHSLIPVERIKGAIYVIRYQKVMIDSDLAELHGVTTKRLNEQVRRNLDRFPEDFMFQLTRAELESLRSQFATSNIGRGGRRHLPYAFTEHGAVMLANVLKSKVAIQASIQVVRAFVRLREMLATSAEFAQRLTAVEKKVGQHAVLIATILEKVAEPPSPPKRRPIGFRPSSEK